MPTTIHLVHPFHSRPVREKWSHCAFTQIALKQATIFRRLGCKVVSYGNWGDESDADEKVTLLDQEGYAAHYADTGLPGHGANGAVIGSPGHMAWFQALVKEIIPRVYEVPGDHVVLHTFADSAAALVQMLPGAQHLEPHVGYDRPPFGANRVYVSQSWRHYLWGKHGSTAGDHRYSWVVLPYYEATDWPFVEQAQGQATDLGGGAFVGKTGAPYVAYLGRMTNDKGLATVVDIAQRMLGTSFKLAGSGTTPDAFAATYNPSANVEYLGTLPGRDRAAFLGNASVLLAPSEYAEPCAGVVCEAALCGTPSVASSWGGYMETVLPGRTGFTAATLMEWISGVKQSGVLIRSQVRESALDRFTLEAVIPQYARIFEQLLSLKGAGWYALPGQEAT